MFSNCLGRMGGERQVEQEACQGEDSTGGGEERAAVGLRRWGGMAGSIELGSHAGAANRLNDGLEGNGTRRREDGHLRLQHVEGQVLVAANEGADFAFEDGNFFGAIESGDAE